MVRQEVEAGLGRHPANLIFDATGFERDDRAALDTHQVMMVLGLADGVPMTAVTSVDPIEHTELGEQIEGSEHRRPTDAAVPDPNLIPDLLSAEVVLSGRHHLDDGLTRGSQPVP